MEHKFFCLVFDSDYVFYSLVWTLHMALRVYYYCLNFRALSSVCVYVYAFTQESITGW